MRLTRLYVDMDLVSGNILELPRQTAEHVARVLRARNGDQITLFNGNGREYLGAIDEVRGSRVTAAVGDRCVADRESSLQITLIQCVPRGDRMDLIVQKATELGVHRVVPVLSQRSVVRLSAAQAESKVAHWRAVAVSACEQCGRTRLPIIDLPCGLAEYLGNCSTTSRKWVLEPETEPKQVAAAIDGPVDVAVGPEGGFSPEELEGFSLAGFDRIRLGPRILRTETAAIAALTWLQVRYGDLDVPR